MGKCTKKHAPLCSKSKIFCLSVLVLCLCILSGTTLAYLVTKTDSIGNQFSPGKVSCEVVNTVENGKAGAVSVRNTGSVPAYIRATIVVNWVSSDGIVLANAPTTGDYEINFVTGNWKKAADGFWYYTSSVEPGESTNVLIGGCNIKSVAPDGYALSVEVVASAIQASGTEAVVESWDSGVKKLDNGNLVIREAENE